MRGECGPKERALLSRRGSLFSTFATVETGYKRRSVVQLKLATKPCVLKDDSYRKKNSFNNR